MRFSFCTSSDRTATLTYDLTVVAAYEAIRYIEKSMQASGTRNRVTHIILCTDSQYLVDAMTFHVATYRENDFRGRKGKRIRNGTLIRKLDELIRSLEDSGVNVDFWEVDRDLNEDADELAARALRGECSYYWRPLVLTPQTTLTTSCLSSRPPLSSTRIGCAAPRHVIDKRPVQPTARTTTAMALDSFDLSTHARHLTTPSDLTTDRHNSLS